MYTAISLHICINFFPSVYNLFGNFHIWKFVPTQVLSSEDIDVEKPAYLSPEHTILVYVPHPLKVSDAKHHTTQVELPVHFRYHRPSKDPDVTSALVQLQHPNVMIRCQGMHLFSDIVKYLIGIFKFWQSLPVSMQGWCSYIFYSILWNVTTSQKHRIQNTLFVKT